MANQPQQPQIPFALHPAEAEDENVLIDYRTSEGQKLHKAAVAPLSPKFTGESLKMLLFARDVGQRAEESDWGPILQIPNGAIKSRTYWMHMANLPKPTSGPML